MPLIEAMACGTAVVTTDNGCNRDYTKNWENCILVLPSDIQQIAISRLQSFQANRASIGLASVLS